MNGRDHPLSLGTGMSLVPQPGSNTLTTSIRVYADTLHTGFDTDYYQARDTLKEDAMTCWKKHARTVDCGVGLSPGTVAAVNLN